MKVSRDPYNCVGRLVLEELKQAQMSYAYACQHKVSNREEPEPEATPKRSWFDRLLYPEIEEPADETIERLTERLRRNCHFDDCQEAADRLEQLEAECKEHAEAYQRCYQRADQLESALEDIVAADHCQGGEYCPHCIARNALAEDREIS